MTIRVRASGVKIVAGCLFAIAAILGTLALTVVNSSANPQSADPCGAPTGTPSPTPTPTATASASPSASQLCDSVSSKGGSGVSPGASAPFSIQVSTTGGTASNVVVTISANRGTPRLTTCPGKTGTDSNHYPTCTIATLNGSQTILAAVDVPASASNGQNVTLTVTTYSTDPAINVPGASASIPVVKSAPPSGTSGNPPSGTGPGTQTGGSNPPPTGTTGLNGPAGLQYGGSPGGGTPGSVSAGAPVASAVTAGTGDPLAYTAGPLRKFLPLINGGSPTKGNGGISPQLPSIPPTGVLPTAKPASYHGIASGPLSRQMLGTQLIGLAALCAAIGIVLIRFWRRTPRPPLAGRAAVAGAGGAGAGGAAAAADATGAADAAGAADATSTGATTETGPTTDTGATTGAAAATGARGKTASGKPAAGGKAAALAKAAAAGGIAAAKASAGTSPSAGRRGPWRRFLRGRHAKPS